MEKQRSDILEFIKSEQGKDYHYKISELQRHRFNHALDVEILANVQFGNDYQILSENLLSWKNNIKQSDKRWNILNSMQGALLRIYCYTNQLETKLRAAVSEYQMFRDKNNELLDVNEKLRKEVDMLKNEIEFLNKNG